jgi:CyaY protein
MDEHEFQRRAEKSLDELSRQLNDAADDYGFEADFNAGALTIEFEEPPGRFVVSPNSPVRQIWVSANVKSFKLDWDDGEQTFVLGSTGQTLGTLIEEAIGQHLGQQVHL